MRRILRLLNAEDMAVAEVAVPMGVVEVVVSMAAVEVVTSREVVAGTFRAVGGT